MKTGDIILTASKSPIAKAIRWWTISKWSHCAVVINDSEYIEATWPRVRITSISSVADIPHTIIEPVNPITNEQQAELTAYLLSKVGRRYDWKGLLSFVFKRNINHKSWYFCSELVAEAYDYIGCPLIARRDASWITPQDIYESTAIYELP